MKKPVFPARFVADHCPRVQRARREIRLASGEELNQEEAVQYGECAFNGAGLGMMCENCGLHLTRPFLNYEVDREFLPQIEQYYRDVAEYEKWVISEGQRTGFIGEGI